MKKNICLALSVLIVGWTHGQDVKSDCSEQYRVVLFEFVIESPKTERDEKIDTLTFSKTLPRYISNFLIQDTKLFSILEREQLAIIKREESDMDKLKINPESLRTTVDKINQERHENGLCPGNTALIGVCRVEKDHISIIARLVDIRSAKWVSSTIKRIKRNEDMDIGELAESIACRLRTQPNSSVQSACEDCSFQMGRIHHSQNVKEVKKIQKMIVKLKKLQQQSMGPDFDPKKISLYRKIHDSELKELTPVLYYLTLSWYKEKSYFNSKEKSMEYLKQAKTFYCDGYTEIEAEIVNELFNLNLHNPTTALKYFNRE
ncbi:MAG: hypothetical protein AAF587_09210 [Bacteroidota bacterium]